MPSGAASAAWNSSPIITVHGGRMNHPARLLRRLHPMLLLAALVACGGGGGGDSGMPAPAPAPGPLTITQPSAFAAGLTGTVALQATSSDPNTASVEFQIDGTAITTDASAPFGTTVDSNAFASGQHVLRARSLDATGNR